VAGQCCLVGGLACGPVEPPVPLRALDSYFAAIASLDPERIAACFRDDAELEDPFGSPIRHGQDDIREYWRHGLCAVAETVEIKVLAALPCGGSVAGHWQMTARSAGGAVAQAEGIDVLRLDDEGMIRRAEGYWDQATFRAALLGEDPIERAG
jgi:steroid Delta-isomerase